MNNDYKLVVINYADENFASNRRACSESAFKYGLADEVIEYRPEDIDVTFRKKNNETLSIKRGAGLWLWKPYFILRTLNQMEDDDFLFYTDSGVFFIKPIYLLVNALKNKQQDIFPFMLPLLENEWTKNETQTLILGEKTKYRNNQYLATYILIRNSKKSRSFISEWLSYMENPICSYPDLITDEKNDTSFIAHREDQSVFSILCKKYKLKAYREPSQYGLRPFEYGWHKNYTGMRNRFSLVSANFEKSDYPQIIISVRKDNPKYKIKTERIKNILYKIKLYNSCIFRIKNDLAFYIKTVLRYINGK